MARQRAEARRSWVGSGEAATEAVWFALREETGATEFLGYETETAEGVVLAILRDGARVTEAVAGDEVAVVLNQTPFYAESGGQAGDTGSVFTAAGAELAVGDTVKKAGDLHVHLGAADPRHVEARRCGRIADRRRPPAPGARQSFGDASAARGAAPAARARM